MQTIACSLPAHVSLPTAYKDPFQNSTGQMYIIRNHAGLACMLNTVQHQASEVQVRAEVLTLRALEASLPHLICDCSLGLETCTRSARLAKTFGIDGLSQCPVDAP